MGNLADALRKRQQDIDDHKNQPRKSYEEDPAAGYEHYKKWIELDFLNKQAADQLTQAFAGLTKEQRLQFFDRTLNDKTKEEFAFRSFQGLMQKAANASSIQSLTDVFANRNNFGVPLPQLYASLDQLLTENQRRNIDRALGGRKAPAERAARICRLLDSGKVIEHIFNNLMSDEKKREYRNTLLEYFVGEGRIANTLQRNANYKDGKTWIDAVEELEEIIGEQKADQIAQQINNLQPLRLSDNKVIRPYQGRIQALRSSIGPNDPLAAEKQTLLDRAEGILVYPAQDYLEQLDAMDAKRIDRQRGPGAASAALGYASVKGYLAGIGDGGLLERLPHKYSTLSEQEQYNQEDVMPAERRSNFVIGVDLTEQEEELLRQNGQGGVDPRVRESVLSILGDIEEMGEKNYWLDDVVKVTEGTLENPVKVEYLGEQGEKNYAFWPVVTAKRAVSQAVEAGDWDKLRHATEEYARRKAIADRMMKTAQTAANQFYYPGNFNSTRPINNTHNAMPTDYLEDFAGHSRVNGLFALYAMTKNTGISAERILDDPAGVLQETAKDFMNTRLLSSCREKSVGSKLAFAFDGEKQNKAQCDWSNKMTPIAKGLDAIAAMMPDREAQVKSAGQFYCAMASTYYELGKEMVPYRVLATASAEKKQLVTELAMILPEEEFDLQEVGARLCKDDWKQTLDPEAALDRLVKEGKLDPIQLIERAGRIAEEAVAGENPDKRDLNSVDNRPIYRRAMLRTYDRLRKLTPPERRPALEDAFRRSQIQHDPSVQKISAGLGREMRTLEQEKSGFFLSSKNTEEFDQMLNKLRFAKRKLDLLSGDPKALNGLVEDNRKKLRSTELSQCITEAKQACYHYAFEKTKGGTRDILHEAGMERKGAAMQSLYLLGEIEDRLGLRSPAKRLLDAVSETALNGRNSKPWVRENCEKHAARAIAALSLEHKNVPPEKQGELLDPKKLEPALKKLMEQPAFRQMVKNEGLEGLADKLVQGPAALTDVYMKAVRQTEPQAQEQSSQITPEQRKQFWAQRESPIQGIAAAK